MFVVFNQKKPKNIDTSPEMKSQQKWIRELFCFCFTKGINFGLKFMGGKNFPNAPMNWFAKRTTAITIIITLLHTQHEVVGNRSSYQATTYYNLQPQYNMYKHMYVYMYISVYIKLGKFDHNHPQSKNNTSTLQLTNTSQCPGTGTWWRSLQPLSPYAQSFPGSLEHGVFQSGSFQPIVLPAIWTSMNLANSGQVIYIISRARKTRKHRVRSLQFIQNHPNSWVKQCQTPRQPYTHHQPQ